MGKRKADADDKDPAPNKLEDDGSEDNESDDDIEIINCDFEWFDPNPAVDFHGLKNLLRQLFDVDHQLFDLSALADLILGQPLLGSTVKCDGEESDPFAFLTILNLHERRDKDVIRQLREYLLSRAQKSNPNLHQQIQKVLDTSNAEVQVGLILTERVINMPDQTVPPMYTMLLEEIQWALDENEPYKFTHYLLISKAYTEVASKLDAADNPPSKKSRSEGDEEVSYFHPEDEILQKHALAFGGFEYEKQGAEGASDAKRTFSELGVRPQGHLVLIEGSKFEGAVTAVAEYLGGPE